MPKGLVLLMKAGDDSPGPSAIGLKGHLYDLEDCADLIHLGDLAYDILSVCQSRTGETTPTRSEFRPPSTGTTSKASTYSL